MISTSMMMMDDLDGRGCTLYAVATNGRHPVADTQIPSPRPDASVQEQWDVLLAKGMAWAERHGSRMVCCPTTPSPDFHAIVLSGGFAGLVHTAWHDLRTGETAIVSPGVKGILQCGPKLFSRDDTEDEAVLQWMRTHDPVEPCVLSISGYDDDSRELYEIPAVREFCVRLWRLGMPACLTPAATWGPDNREYGIADGLGAYEVWALSEGRLGKTIEIDIEEQNEFLVELAKCQERADDWLNNGVHKVEEGPQRITPMRWIR